MKKFIFFLILFSLLFALSIENVSAITNRSEIRGWYIAEAKNADWDLIAQTAKDYKINMLVPGCVWLYGAIYPSKYAYQFYGTPPSRDELALALEAAHSRGIEVHCLMLVFFIWEGFPKDLPIPEEWKAVNCNNETVNWADPCHPKVREFIKNLTTELAANYDIDGFMFDYIRYDQTGYSAQESYSIYCKEWFENDTGIHVENWPTDVCSGGPYHRQWMEWRVTPITKIVENVRKWMLAIRPDLEFSAAVFPIFSSNAYAYWRWDIGQDTANWIGKDYLEFVAPMGYTNDVSNYKQYLTNSTKYFVGGPEGKIPVVRWTSSAVHPTTPEQLKSKIEACREVGCDGWVIWKYGGPGSPDSSTPDLRPYFQIIDLPDTFSLGNIRAFSTSTEAVVTWITDKPTNSKVEYNSSPLFVSYLTSGSWGDGFPYWDVKHIPGLVVEDNSNVTTHSITLTGLQPNTTYYFRVQSEDESGIVTSKVFNFTTGTGTYPISITGTVRDSETGSPIRAIISCGNSGNVSGADGRYIIKLKSPGSCNLRAESFGYRTKSIPISFSGSITQDIDLEPIKISIKGKLKDKHENPVQAEISAYQDGNLIASTQTDSEGNYNLQLRQGIYSIRFKVLGTNLWLEFPSINLLTNLTDKIKEVTIESSNKVSFIIDIGTNEVTRVNVAKPTRVLMNGTEIGNAISLSTLKSNQWYYDSVNGKLYLKLDPYPKTECIYECCKNEEHYYDKSCPLDQYCEDRICKPKMECPFECCVNEELYLNKSCNPPEYCVERKCVEYSGYWKFDEGSGNIAHDSSGLGNNGTVYGANWTSNCMSGYCLDFDGVDDYVFVPNSSSLIISDEITIEAWVYPRGWSGKYPGIVAKYYPRGYLLGIHNSSRSWYFWLRTEGGLGIIWSDSPVELNKWVHIAVVRDSNGKMRMYINGTLQQRTTTLTGSIAEPDRDFLIGEWDGNFDGIIDEIRVYARALSEEEILYHAHEFDPKCSDGTPYGFCSKTKPLYCKDGSLISNCSLCGCPEGQACDGLECIPISSVLKTFGKTDVGTNTWVVEKNNITGCKFNLPEDAGLRSVSIYFYSGSGDNYKAAIYDSGGNLKAVTEQRTWPYGKTWSWETFNFSTPVFLPAGDYYITFWGDGGVILAYDSSMFDQTFINTTVPYNEFPDRIVKEREYNYNMSMYVTYSPVT